ncbi:acetoacetate decarboxylase family protein [Pseudonocardia sp. NPDC049154]|uniref:acetoacetate decarboxylase family protein n=1 Tax=Pseudonocardia sp. NPDC049154 TaxID=3155501 RepID=UPI0033C5907B
MTPFLRTPSDVLAAPRFVGEQLLVRFRTDPQVYRRLLPPPLEPAEEPIALAAVGRWRSNCVGDYAGGSVALSAVHAGDAGGFAVGMWMDSEPAVHFGREVFGEPKKLGTSGLTREGTRAHGWIERGGVRLVSLHATLGEDQGASNIDRLAFNYRARTAADGRGLAGPAILTRTTFATRLEARFTGTGTVTLRSGPHDPAGEIPVLEVLGAEYQVHDLRANCVPSDEVPAAEFLLYHLGRQDDWRLLDTLDPNQEERS